MNVKNAEHELDKNEPVHHLPTIAEVLEQSPVSIGKIAHVLLDKVYKWDGVRVDPTHNALHVAALSTFCTLKPTNDHLEVEIVLRRKLEDQRIARTAQVGKSSHSNFININSDLQVDSRLMGWLHEAYESNYQHEGH